MPQFIIAYLGKPDPMSTEDSKQHLIKYSDWLTSLGVTVISPANPIKNTKTITSDGIVLNKSTSTMSGFTLIETESNELALSIAKTCPFLDLGGSIEVSELINM